MLSDRLVLCLMSKDFRGLGGISQILWLFSFQKKARLCNSVRNTPGLRLRFNCEMSPQAPCLSTLSLACAAPVSEYLVLSRPPWKVHRTFRKWSLGWRELITGGRPWGFTAWAHFLLSLSSSCVSLWKAGLPCPLPCLPAMMEGIPGTDSCNGLFLQFPVRHFVIQHNKYTRSLQHW